MWLPTTNGAIAGTLHWVCGWQAGHSEATVGRSSLVNEVHLIGAYIAHIMTLWDFLGCSDSKETACNAGDLGSMSGSGRSPVKREWLPTPVFLPGELHGEKSLVG